jgi:raffinose/stachyose/melibiose transport system substrate-binding protein
MKYSKLLCVVLILTCVVIFAGCDKKSDDSSKVTLVYWTMWNETEPQGQVIGRAAEAFTQETGIKLDINFNGRDIRRTLQPALDAGEVIDFFDEDIDRVNSAWGNYLLPLDSYVSKSYPTTGGSPYSSVVHKAILDVVKLRGGGSVKTIPYQPFIFTTMYNKDLFSRAGITSTPKNWDDMLAACAKLSSIGVAGITVDDAYMACLFGYTVDRLVGSDACKVMVDRDDFSSPAILEFGRIWENMARNGYIISSAAGNVWPAGQIQDFAPGKAAMYLNGTWLPNEIRGNAPNMNWGSFAWPAISPDGDGIEANNFSAQCFGINKNSKYPEEAFRFIVYMTTGQWDSTLAAETLGIPMGVTSNWPTQLAEAKVVVENTAKQLPWAVGFEDKPEINAKIIENFSRLIKGEFNAQQFADAMRR